MQLRLQPSIHQLCWVLIKTVGEESPVNTLGEGWGLFFQRVRVSAGKLPSLLFRVPNLQCTAVHSAFCWLPEHAGTQRCVQVLVVAYMGVCMCVSALVLGCAGHMQAHICVRSQHQTQTRPQPVCWAALQAQVFFAAFKARGKLNRSCGSLEIARERDVQFAPPSL